MTDEVSAIEAGSRHGNKLVASARASTNGDVHARSVLPGEQTEATSRFARVFLFVLLGSMLLVVAINFLGNGVGLFPSPLCPALSDRAWKARRLEAAVREGHAPKALILGSSRVMQVNPDYIEHVTGLPAFNLAVSGGNVVDCLAMFRLALRVGARPALIIINVDESMLVGGVGAGNLRLAGNSELLQVLPAREIATIALDVATGMSQASTTSSLARLLRGRQASGDDGRTFVQAEHDFVFLPNGYRINVRRARKRDRGTFDMEAEVRLDLAGVSSTPQSAKDKLKFDPRMIVVLHTLLSEARKQGIEVKVLTTPENPLVVGTPMGAARAQLHDQLVALLRDECRRMGYTYRDFTKLASFGGDEREFWDSTHQTPLNIARMMNALFDLPSSAPMGQVPSDIEVLKRYGLGSMLSKPTD